MSSSQDNLILFIVEGATDKLFYKKLVAIIIKKYQLSCCKFDFINLKGVGNFKSKALAKYKNEICPKYKGFNHFVFLAYDSDVFEFNRKPPVDWDAIENDFRALGLQNIEQLKCEKNIEDLFIIDVANVCNGLKIRVPQKLTGSTGLEKINGLFKRADKIYQKGYSGEDFINKLDINLILEQKSAFFTVLINLVKRVCVSKP